MKKKKVGSNEPGKFQQYLTAIVVNLATLAFGTSIGWVSPVLPRLLSSETPVGTEPMTAESASWLVGGLCIGALITTPILGPISEKFGRKFLGRIIALPAVICWLLKFFAPNSSSLIAARFLAGVNGAGCYFLIPLYISECTSDAIRGTAGSLMMLFLNIGIVFSFVIGPILSFGVFALVNLSLPLIYFGCFLFLPETPVYLVRQNKIAEATKSLTWFKGGNKRAVEQELTYLRSQIKEASVSSKAAKFSDLVKDKGTIKGMIIAFGLYGGQQMCGMLAMLSYSTTIFEMAGSSVTPDLATIIIGIIQLLGSYLSTLFIERAGRKFLLLISCLFMSICHLTLGIFCYFLSLEYDLKFIAWVPLTALSLFVLTHSLGMSPVPYVIVSEIFKPDVASLASSIALCILWFVLFLIVKFFATAMVLIGISGCFFILAGTCASMFFFVLAVVPETKGRTIESIFNQLNGTPDSSNKA